METTLLHVRAMVTVLKRKIRPANFVVKVAAYFFTLSLLFCSMLVLFHFFYERNYKIENLNHTLEQNALLVNNYLDKFPVETLDSLTRFLANKEMRVTVMDLDGKMLYDNYISPTALDNHANRPEVMAAAQKGVGSDIRLSSTMQTKYYYFAKQFTHYYVRTALPYTGDINRLITPGYLFFGFTLLLLILLAAGMTLGFNRLSKRVAGTQQEQERHIRQELTQNLSHELKTPVSSILGYMETLVLKPDLEREKVRFFIERSYVQTQRLSRLIEDISLLNRLDSAPERFPFEQVDVYEVIENVVKDISLQLSERSISVNLLPPQALWIRGNSSLLYSIFRNLFDNVIAYAGTGVTISISWSDKGDSFLYFSFADNGPGVAPEHLPHLFDRFYRIDSGRSRKQGGTGLGLAIVKNGVLAHGGAIEVQTDGKGLSFFFKIRK